MFMNNGDVRIFKFKSGNAQNLDSLYEYYQLHKDSTGIFSFSKPIDKNSFPSPLNSILMWAHYSNGFRGYCIEFSYSKLRNSIEHLNETQLGSAEVKYVVEGKLPIVSIRKFMEETIEGQTGLR
jgi:hypothetical protein